MDAKQLRNEIIKPALVAVGLYSKPAEDLVFGTACVESNCGEYLRQINGPALGIFQMEPATHDDIYKNFLKYKPELKARVMRLFSPGLSVSENLKSNLMYAAAMCRIYYLRAPLPIPEDLQGQAEYWKKYYNTVKGKGSVEKYIAAYREEQ